MNTVVSAGFLLVIFSFSLAVLPDALAQDWANLARFAQANADLGPANPDEARVVFMGDSITEAWEVQAPEFFEGRPFINRGISGQTTPQMLVRFRPRCTLALPICATVCR